MHAAGGANYTIYEAQEMAQKFFFFLLVRERDSDRERDSGEFSAKPSSL